MLLIFSICDPNLVPKLMPLLIIKRLNNERVAPSAVWDFSDHQKKRPCFIIRFIISLLPEFIKAPQSAGFHFHASKKNSRILGPRHATKLLLSLLLKGNLLIWMSRNVPHASTSLGGHEALASFCCSRSRSVQRD